MSKNSFVLTLGVLVVVIPFLGVPDSWKTVAFILIGFGIITAALLLRKDIASGEICTHLQEEKKTDSYSQNGMIIPRQQPETNEHESR